MLTSCEVPNYLIFSSLSPLPPFNSKYSLQHPVLKPPQRIINLLLLTYNDKGQVTQHQKPQLLTKSHRMPLLMPLHPPASPADLGKYPTSITSAHEVIFRSIFIKC